MRQTQTLRPDKTGKALLTVLRHLGRLHEVRPLPAQRCVFDPLSLSLCQVSVLRGRTTRIGALVNTRSASSRQGALFEACNSHQQLLVT